MALAKGSETGVLCHLLEATVLLTIGGGKINRLVAPIFKEISQYQGDLIEAFVNEIVTH
jgi:hypothetical protein